MVCTRKKDYGDPTEQPKVIKRYPTELMLIKQQVISVRDAAAEVDKPRPCTEFTLFPQLPCELRLMIWQASMTSRLIAVGPKGLGQPRSPHSKKILPALLSVNKDSRYCALRHYTLVFTITLSVDTTGLHRWGCHAFQGTTYRANVVMSSDDTLGLFGWETLNFGHGTRFRVKSAMGKGPWKTFPTSHEVQPEVKKVAFLGRRMASYPEMVQTFNSVPSWDLDSILHKETPYVRKFRPGRDIRKAHFIKNKVLVHSRKFNGSLEDWGKRLIFRAERGTLPLWQGAPDILAFELGKKSEQILRPKNFVQTNSIQELYRVLSTSFVENILDDFYMSWEWKMRAQYPDSRGF